MHDLVIALYLIMVFVPYLLYRFEKFSLLTEGTEQWEEASLKPYSPYARIYTMIGLGLMVAVYSLNSFSIAYLRSLMDIPRAECRIHFDEADESSTVTTDDGITIITAPDELTGSIKITLYVWRTPSIPQLELGGELVNVQYEEADHCYPFDRNYFRQKYECKANTEDIHDGSVLTLTCGKWQYEWVFDADGA